MKPCDAKDVYETLTYLNEQGIQINGYTLDLIPNHVQIRTQDCTLILPQSIFKRFAEWFVGDQVKEK